MTGSAAVTPGITPGATWDEWGFQAPFEPAGTGPAAEDLEGRMAADRLETPFLEGEWESESNRASSGSGAHSCKTATGCLVVGRHPLLRRHAGSSPDLIVRWNAISAPGDVDVVIHLHGFSGRRASMHLARHKEPISGLDFADPAGSAAPGRTRPTVGLLPRGHFYGGASGDGFSFPALVRPGALGKLAQDGLARFTAHTGIAVRMGRLIVTVHSGGGAALRTILTKTDTDPDEIHVFDGLYGPGDAIVSWAKRRIARELDSPAAVPPALRILYRPSARPHKGTQRHSEAVALALCPTLSAPAAARLRPHFRVDQTSVGHNDIPRRFGWALLANSATELPGVIRKECGAGGAGTSSESAIEATETTSAGEAAPNERAESEREAEGMSEHQGAATFNAFDGYTGFEDAAGLTTEPEGLAWEEAEGVADEASFAIDEEAGEDATVAAESLADVGLEWETAGTYGEDPGASQWNESPFGSGEEPESEELGEAGGSYATEEGPDEREGSAGDLDAGSLASLNELLEPEAEAYTSLADRVKGVAAFVMGPALQRRSSGPAVAALQRSLSSLGHDVGVDGDFGPNTERAVRAFQSAAGLTANGVVGPETKSAIAGALARRRAVRSSGATPATSTLCASIARIAEAEWRRWHPASGHLTETQTAAAPILQQYYREGVGVEVTAQDLQNPQWQRKHPWSAVFVSWVMQAAGATGFRRSAAHRVYVAAARRNRLDGNTASPFWAYRPTEVAPQLGDLVCGSRDNSGATYDNIGDGKARATHCDIVTEVRPGGLRTIGGNVRQDVGAKETFRTLPDGRLALDGSQARFFAVVRCRGAIDGPTQPEAFSEDEEGFDSAPPALGLALVEPPSGGLATELDLAEDETDPAPGMSFGEAGPGSVQIENQAADEINWCQIRQTIAATARAEEARWTRANGTKIRENDPSMLPILTGYWGAVPGFQDPADARRAARRSAADDPEWPWSAAFICWVMRTAGVRPEHGFAFGGRHLDFIVGALRNREQSARDRPFWVADHIEIQRELRVQPGDLVCFNRCCPQDGAPATPACPRGGSVMTQHTYASLRRRYWVPPNQNRPARGCSHTSLVVGTIDRGGTRFLETIGGNEGNSVRLVSNVVRVNGSGGIENPQRRRIFGVVRLVGC